MSAILGVFYDEPRPVDDGLVTRMLDPMRSRGSDRTGVRSASGGALAVARNDWELVDGFSGDVLAVEDGDLVIAADASIYYRKDLQQKLAAKEVRVTGTTPSHLILAAYRAWGEQCVQQLEGDYAFVLWDRKAGRVFCARDFGGKRPLYYADLGGSLVVASTMSALLVHPDCPDALNHIHLAETAAGLWPSAHETAYRAISLVPAGWTLSQHRGGETRLTQQWRPPEIEPEAGLPFEDAAIELRHLLERAVDERLDPTGVTAVWMSGGWDSTAVFGAGQQVLRHRRNSQRLRPVSISYPPGDPGREDELISAVADWWGASIHWLDIRDIPLIDSPGDRAAGRDEPAAHVYEHWNRALGRGSRSVGAHVAVEGNGGDQLFQVSPTFLADLVRTGRWVAFVREWRALRLSGFTDFFRWAVKPRLPPAVLDAATVIRRGRRLHGVYERWMPPWMSQRLVRTLAERQKLHVPPRTGTSCSAYETHFYLGAAFFPRILGAVAGLALEEGVELRSPLYDRRVVDFAAARPRTERSSGGDTKRLLRRAMRGLLPDHVLAPRPFRTGVTSGYFARETRRRFPDLFRGVSHSWALAELGIIEPAALTRSFEQYVRRPDDDVAIALLHALHVEHWLRARLRRTEAPAEDAQGRRLVDGDAFAASSL